MKIVIAPDSYKESLSAMQVALEIEAGFKEIFPQAQYYKVPVADGGEGTVQALIEAGAGQRIERIVTGPMRIPVNAVYGMIGSTAVIEMASASGLELVPIEKRNPLLSTSFGTGELILAALERGARHFILGIGGSASNDAGAGMLQALGVRLLDEHGAEILRGGAALAQLRQIDISGLDPRIHDSVFEVACDVDNPLLGLHGASAIFGPQKGATPEMVQTLDASLTNFAQVVKHAMGIDMASIPGAGAGGGISAAAMAFLNGRLRPGIAIVADAVGLSQIIQGADLVITGEGRIDQQTIHGKTPIGVAKIAQEHGVPVIAIAGSMTDNYGVVHQHGIAAVFSAVNRACTLSEAYRDAAANVRITARNVASVLALGRGFGD